MSRHLTLAVLIGAGVAVSSGAAAVAAPPADGDVLGFVDQGEFEIGGEVRSPSASSSPQAVLAPGGGEGGSVQCEYRSLGPAGEVARIQGLVNAAQQVTVQDPTVVNDVVQDPAQQLADEISRHTWFRLNGSTPEVLHMVRCPGGLWTETRWVAINAAGEPLPTPQDFIPGLLDSVTRRVPTPIPRVAPADELPEGWAFVQMDTYFWVDQAPGQWDVVSATASVPSLSVTVQAEPVRLVVTPGDGGGPVVCEGPQPAIDNDTYVEGMPGCTYVYGNSSATAANGATFPLQLAIEWHVTWSASNGQAGDLGALRTDSAVRDLAVAEIQAVLTD